MQRKQEGFIQILIILGLLIVIISLLGVSIGEVIGNKTLQENFSLVFKVIKYIWENYLLEPVKIIGGLLKEYLKNLLF